MNKKQSHWYYQTVERYHDLAEASHQNPMVPAGLIRPHVSADGLVVDIGGGTGFNAKFLCVPPSRYVAADLSALGVSQVLEKKRGSGVICDVASLPFRDSAFTTVLSSWAIEHFEEPKRVLDEMVRVISSGGKIIIWGPNWDNIFRKDFPQFVHKPRWRVERIRWRLFLRMVKNEFLPFRYEPYVNTDVAALKFPDCYVSGDTDATHCVLCQETVKFFEKKGLRVTYMSDFSKMSVHLRNSFFIWSVRFLLTPWLPVLRRLPLIRWFVIRFPVVIQKV